MNHQHIFDTLQFHLEAKLAALKHYLAITGEMNISIKNDDFAKLKSLISGRHKYMRKVQGIDKSITAIVGANGEKIDRFSHHHKKMLDSFRDEFLRVMEAVSPLEQAVMLRVEDEGRKLRRELLAVRKNRYAVASYGFRRATAPRYLDTKK
jgi:hypothetical protein